MKSFIVTLTVTLVLACNASGQVLVNFYSLPGSPVATYNDVRNDLNTNIPLVNVGGNVTSLRLSHSFTIGVASGGAVLAQGEWASDAETSYLRTREDELTSGNGIGPNGFADVTLTGLAPDVPYSIRVFGSSSIFAAGTTEYTMEATTGGSTESISWPTGAPKDTFFDHTWTVSDTDGTIRLLVDASMNSGNALRLGTVNVIEIAQIPEPSVVAAVFGLVGLLIVAVRRVRR